VFYGRTMKLFRCLRGSSTLGSKRESSLHQTRNGSMSEPADSLLFSSLRRQLRVNHIVIYFSSNGIVCLFFPTKQTGFTARSFNVFASKLLANEDGSLLSSRSTKSKMHWGSLN